MLPMVATQLVAPVDGAAAAADGGAPAAQESPPPWHATPPSVAPAAAAVPGSTVLEFEAGGEWTKYATCTGSDSMPIAWYNRHANETYFMVATHRRPYAGRGPTLNTLSGCTAAPVFLSHDEHGYDSGPQSYANFQWLQSVRVFANGTAAGLVHNEFKGEFAPLGTYCTRECADGSPINASGCRDKICELWSTGLAISADGGAAFKLAAKPPQHLVAALPHKFKFNEPIAGYGAVSPMLKAADGSYYGSINVVNSCNTNNASRRHAECGDTAAGNCVWRATDLTDPRSFRARDSNGEFTVQWASAYASPGEGKGEARGVCATLPVTDDGPFGNHVVFRRIVQRTAPAAAGAASPPGGGIGSAWQQRRPHFIALGDVEPYNGRVKYSLSYEPDFGKAMHNISLSWTAPQFLMLGLGPYFYPTLLDVRSPELGVEEATRGGGIDAQEDGDSFALVSYPSVVAHTSRLGPVVSVRVAGAGSGMCNGLYQAAPIPPRFGSVSQFFKLDETHAIYANANVWHLAHLGVSVWYSSVDASPVGGGPPATGWVVAKGDRGAEPAPGSIVSLRGPNVTNSSVSSLYLYLRGSGGIMRRKVQLRNVDGP